MDIKNFKNKAIEPVHTKITKIGQEITGVLVSLEMSTKFNDGYALKYFDGDVLNVTFINKLAYDLFKNNGVNSGQEFSLIYKENRTSASSGLEYRFFELYFN